VPRSPARPPELVGRVFRGSVVVRAGLLTPAQLRTSAWRRLFPDVYACTTADVDHGLRALAVSRLLLPGAVVSGRSAAVLWGVDLADRDDDVVLTVPVSCRAGTSTGIALTRRALPRDQVTVRRGTRITTPVRTALDLARRRPLEDAVADLDRFVRSGPVDLASVRAAAAVLSGRDCRHVRRVTEVADGLAESPQETRLRLLLRRSGLPEPVAQHVVRDGSGFVARVDLAWPDRRLAVEYDGAWHGDPAQFRADRQRLNRLTSAGWRVVFVTAADLRHPDALIARLRRLLAAPTSG
jgi:very-short-patch-repair endonuclease